MRTSPVNGPHASGVSCGPLFAGAQVKSAKPNGVRVLG